MWINYVVLSIGWIKLIDSPRLPPHTYRQCLTFSHLDNSGGVPVNIDVISRRYGLNDHVKAAFPNYTVEHDLRYVIVIVMLVRRLRGLGVRGYFVSCTENWFSGLKLEHSTFFLSYNRWWDVNMQENIYLTSMVRVSLSSLSLKLSGRPSGSSTSPLLFFHVTCRRDELKFHNIVSQQWSYCTNISALMCVNKWAISLCFHLIKWSKFCEQFNFSSSTCLQVHHWELGLYI